MNDIYLYVHRLRIFVPREVLLLADPSLAAEQLGMLEADDALLPLTISSLPRFLISSISRQLRFQLPAAILPQ